MRKNKWNCWRKFANFPLKLRNRFPSQFTSCVRRRKFWMTNSSKTSNRDIIICWCFGSNKKFREKLSVYSVTTERFQKKLRRNFTIKSEFQKHLLATLNIPPLEKHLIVLSLTSIFSETIISQAGNYFILELVSWATWTKWNINCFAW